MTEETIFDPFGNTDICKCKETRPEAIGKIIPKEFDDADEPYICGWCTFVRDAGIENSLDFILQGIEKPKKAKVYLDEDEAENEAGLQDLEDWGAFSDEGIMPGCHSDYVDEFGSGFRKSCEEYELMRRFFGATITFIREKLGMTVEDLAKAVDVPAYIIRNLESGNEDITFGSDKNSILNSVPVSGAAIDEAVISRPTQWWENKSDGNIIDIIRERIIKLVNIHG